MVYDNLHSIFVAFDLGGRDTRWLFEGSGALGSESGSPQAAHQAMENLVSQSATKHVFDMVACVDMHQGW